ncbi:DNA-binding transcriptional MerR regulator [Archangium gephyra]|uniref:DNA-binding transcriptional MerR regulator n=1 Tax=Archangium gephyra TaxID=48 RepID=A0AAC8Q353_9BACT|nr:MerR family transcriptional regulator [Archangium gephyra]AKJ00250.1 Transcriptional regulator, MerR family [Archangium gephyra]REG33050.1 DNA-binding transcriptional MerR regulator [Archangium gephyra]
MAERSYRIHVAAELSGVRVELIRAWERRYGVLAPRRTPSGYRVYTDRDVALLRRLKQLTEEGVSISEAATMLPQLREELDTAQPAPEPTPGPGATSLTAWRDEVLAAAAALDQRRVSRVLDEVLASLTPLKAYEQVLVPLLREVGERWHTGAFSVGQEHLVTQEVRARVITLLHAAPDSGRRRVVLACFPDEQHELGVLGAALRMRHAGLSVTLLGQRMPAAEVGRVARELKAELVGLSAVTDHGAQDFEETLARIVAGVPKGTPIWVGGAAARVHQEVCERLGVHLFDSSEDWSRLLGG